MCVCCWCRRYLFFLIDHFHYFLLKFQCFIATFGTAFGGILFSIELTTASYSVRNLPRAYLSAAIATLVFLNFGQQNQMNLFSNVNYEYRSWDINLTNLEVLICIGIGIVCGLLGVVFVTLVEVSLI